MLRTRNSIWPLVYAIVAVGAFFYWSYSPNEGFISAKQRHSACLIEQSEGRVCM
jgi:hypothetical protein